MKSSVTYLLPKCVHPSHNLFRLAVLVLCTFTASHSLTTGMLHAQDAPSLQPRELVGQLFPGIDRSLLSDRNDLVYGDTDWVLADPGKMYFVYGKSVDKIGVKDLPGGVWKLSWCDVKTGERFDQQVVAISGGDYTFGKPDIIVNQTLVYIYNAKDAWTPPGVK